LLALKFHHFSSVAGLRYRRVLHTNYKVNSASTITRCPPGNDIYIDKTRHTYKIDMTTDAPWDSNQYLTFAGPRLRPAHDLMARIPIEAPATILDLGCSARNVTRFLGQRWPDAVITGIDMSREMLARAKLEVPGIQLIEADLATWSPTQRADLVFSNAVLQWIPGHEHLIPTIAGYVSPGGVLAVQIPHNDNATSTRAVKEVAKSGP
jgi:trans-aconitate 2-methyltransferase